MTYPNLNFGGGAQQGQYNLNQIDPSTGKPYSNSSNGLGQYFSQLYKQTDLAGTGSEDNLIDLGFDFKLNPDGSAVTPPTDTGMGAMGITNLLFGGAQALAGAHYQNEILHGQQEVRDLAKTKYTDLRGDQEKLHRVNKERSDLAQSQINAYKG